MGKLLTDASIPVITSVLMDDLVWIERAGDGANATKRIKVQDLCQSLGDLLNKWVYVGAVQMLEPQVANAEFGMLMPPMDVTIPSLANLSCGKARITATNDTTLTIKKNGTTTIGTAFFPAGSPTPVISFPSDVTLIGGADDLSLVNSASPDPTLSQVIISIWGKR